MSNRILSTAEILERTQKENAVTQVAMTTPEQLTEADLAILPVEIFRELSAAGKLTHLGVGVPKGPRWRRTG